MQEQDPAVEFLTFMVKNLVDHPDDVRVERSVDEMGVLLTLDVHPEDMGKVIGRKGATAKAIRTLLRVVGMRSNARVNMKITEPEGGHRPTSFSDEESGEASYDQPVVDDAIDETPSITPDDMA